jgi:hypothetical protein
MSQNTFQDQLISAEVCIFMSLEYMIKIYNTCMSIQVAHIFLPQVPMTHLCFMQALYNLTKLSSAVVGSNLE